MSKLTIGITFRDDQTLDQTWWGSGIGQNIKFYYDLFELMGHEPCMVLNSFMGNFKFKGKDYKTITFEDILKNKNRFDLFLEAGITIPPVLKSQLLNIHRSKIVGLRCGHQYFIASEGIFVKQTFPVHQWIGGQDRMWVLPHYGKHASFLATMHGCTTDVVPYIWEPDFVDRTFTSAARLEQPDIYILEPNISVAKNALVPMAILQNLYDANPESFGRAYVGNSADFCNKDYFLHNFVSNLPVLNAKANKVFFVGRVPMNQIFKKPDILLGFQHDNELNNLYKEAIYMGIPFVHNSPAYAEVGFYYPELEVHKGADQVLKAIGETGPLNEKVVERDRNFLHRFSIHNPQVQQAYKMLLDQLMDGSAKSNQATPLRFPNNDFEISDGTSRCHFLAKGYRSRKSIMHWDDSQCKDEWQDQVYVFAHRIAKDRGYSRILDFGCGSGYKLMKHFKEFNTCGYELDPALSFLKKTYPDREWREGGLDASYFNDADMVICSDVIEHLPEPQLLLHAISQSSAKTVVLSSPSAEIFADFGGTSSRRFGPPAIPTHFREWSTLEFGRFVNQFLPVSEHNVLDVYQGTQVLFSDRDADYGKVK